MSVPLGHNAYEPRCHHALPSGSLPLIQRPSGSGRPFTGRTAVQARPSQVAAMPPLVSGCEPPRSMCTSRKPSGAPTTRTRTRCSGRDAKRHTGSLTSGATARRFRFTTAVRPTRVVSGPISPQRGPRSHRLRTVSLPAASRAINRNSRAAAPSATCTRSIASESARLLARNLGRQPPGASRMTPSLPVTRLASSSQPICDISPAHEMLSMRQRTHSPFQRASTSRTGSARPPGVASWATSVSRTRPSTSKVSRPPCTRCVQGAARRSTHERSSNGSRTTVSIDGAIESGTPSPASSGFMANSSCRISTCRCGGPAPLSPLHASSPPFT